MPVMSRRQKKLISREQYCEDHHQNEAEYILNNACNLPAAQYTFLTVMINLLFALLATFTYHIII